MKRALLTLSLIGLSCLLAYIVYLQVINLKPYDAPFQQDKVALNADKLSTLVNEWRYENHLRPFTKNERLCNLAATRAAEIVTDFSHDGFIPNARKIYAPGTKFGENLSSNSPTTKEVDILQAWLDSPKHRENIENKRYTQMCIVCNASYCAQELSTDF